LWGLGAHQYRFLSMNECLNDLMNQYQNLQKVKALLNEAGENNKRSVIEVVEERFERRLSEEVGNKKNRGKTEELKEC
jgi:hypothetical protein